MGSAPSSYLQAERRQQPTWELLATKRVTKARRRQLPLSRVQAALPKTLPLLTLSAAALCLLIYYRASLFPPRPATCKGEAQQQWGGGRREAEIKAGKQKEALALQ